MDVGGANDQVVGLRTSVLTGLRDGGTGVDALARVCEACVELLPIDGASVSVMAGTSSRETLYASDDVVARIEALQFSLGEGPCFEAFETKRPVLAADVRRANTAWPIFAAEIAADPIGALFGFPLVSGAISIGALDMYRREPGWLSPTEVVTAMRVVDIATLVLLGMRLEDGEAAWVDLSPSRAQVHQATGMLIAAFGIPADQALARLRGYAFAHGKLIHDVADDLVTRKLAPEAVVSP